MAGESEVSCSEIFPLGSRGSSPVSLDVSNLPPFARARPSAFHLSFPFSSSAIDGTKMEYIKNGNLLGIQRS